MQERIRRTILRCRSAVHYKNGPWSTGALGALGGAAMMVSPSTFYFGLATVVVSIVLLLWGVRIHGMYILSPWWRGKPSPFWVKAGVTSFDFAPGSSVAGIPWSRGFSHVWVTIRNVTNDTVEGVDAGLAPEYPIIGSSVRCDLADCRIAPLHGGAPQVTLVLRYPDGTERAEAHDPKAPGNFSISPVHRLICDKLPSGAEVRVDIATVRPVSEQPGGWPWKTKRTDPTYLRVRIHWDEGGCTYAVDDVLELKGLEGEERP